MPEPEIDIQETAETLDDSGGGRHSSYLSKKDIRSIAIVLVVLGILLTPVYMVMKRKSQKALCSQNCKAIQGAMLLYMEVWDGQFPPAYARGDNDEPVLLDGKPFNWASTIYEYMGKRASFRCPGASDSEVAPAYHPYNTRLTLETTYGMYLPRSTAPLSSIADPARSALIAETANFGAEDTYNPAPYKTLKGEIVPIDGFVIGWNTGNAVDWYGTSLADDMPSSVTRLAFYGTKDGQFRGNGPSRHDGGIHVLFVDGHVETVPPNAAIARYLDVGGDLGGLWATR